MKSAPARKKTGRPPALVADPKTLKTIEGLGKIQATTRECAAVLSVSHQTFIAFMNAHPAVGEALEKGKEGGKTSLRRTQFALAKKNAAMAIFLGKNYLDQTDRQDISQSVTVDVTVTDARSKLERLLLRQHGAGADQVGAGKPH
ncbi:MAG: hypothetical protein M9939_26700 [Mesorhizobium sp.]|nr:hypothetical protein [Mesorhizobium sp.]MCO5085139.1 hypothetical protein [Rhizobiaceae bacterium]MCO5164684.1 hypothetical protein [Mesorhizobium sp.]